MGAVKMLVVEARLVTFWDLLEFWLGVSGLWDGGGGGRGGMYVDEAGGAVRTPALRGTGGGRVGMTALGHRLLHHVVVGVDDRYGVLLLGVDGETDQCARGGGAVALPVSVEEV